MPGHRKQQGEGEQQSADTTNQALDHQTQLLQSDREFRLAVSAMTWSRRTRRESLSHQTKPFALEVDCKCMWSERLGAMPHEWRWVQTLTNLGLLSPTVLLFLQVLHVVQTEYFPQCHV